MSTQRWVFLIVSLFLFWASETDSEPPDSQIAVASTKELGAPS